MYIALKHQKIERKETLTSILEAIGERKKQAYIHFVTDKNERKSGIPAPTDLPQEWYVAVVQMRDRRSNRNGSRRAFARSVELISECPGGPGQSFVDECSGSMDDLNHPSNIYHRLTEILDEVRTIVALQSCPGICEAISLLIRFFFIHVSFIGMMQVGLHHGPGPRNLGVPNYPLKKWTLLILMPRSHQTFRPVSAVKLMGINVEKQMFVHHFLHYYS